MNGGYYMKNNFRIRSTIGAVTVALVLVLTSVAARSQGAFCCGSEQPSSQTNSGTEFLLVFMQNESDDESQIPPTTDYQDVYIAALDQAATVTITDKAYPLFSVVKNLGAFQSATVRLNTAYPQGHFIVESNEAVNKNAVRVVSTAAIVCYGMNHKAQTADAFLALPKHVATTDYVVLSFPNSNPEPDIQGAPRASEFAVAAFEDKTQVTITPPVPTAGGNLPNVPVTYTLDAGECIQVQTDPNITDLDLTGTTVTSSGPITVYGGHVRAEVPHNFTRPGGGFSRDHLAEAIPPTSSWGNHYIVANFKTRTTGDLFRVLANPSNTKPATILVNGKPWTVLPAGKYADSMVLFSTTVADNIYSVESNEPILVGLYANTTTIDQGTGDPFLAIMPPVEQAYTDFTYFISNDPVYSQQWLMAITEQSGAGNISLTNSAGVTTQQPPQSFIAATPFSDTAIKNKYSVAFFNQSASVGANRIKTTNDASKGIIILAYGFGPIDSYGYTAGSLLKPLHGIAAAKGRSPFSAPSPTELPSYTIRNIYHDPVLLDSIRMEYSSNPEQIEVKATNVPMTYPGMLEMAGHQYVQFAPVTVPKEPIVGEAVVYYHSGNWMRMQPLHLPIEIAPGTQMSVARMAVAPAVQVSPNPSVNGVTMLRFSLSESAKGSLKVYDALGRQMPFSFEGLLGEGENSLPIITRGFAKGMYYYQLAIAGQNITLTGSFAVL